jgi:hypothetical protein
MTAQYIEEWLVYIYIQAGVPRDQYVSRCREFLKGLSLCLTQLTQFTLVRADESFERHLVGGQTHRSVKLEQSRSLLGGDPFLKVNF